MTFPQSDPTAPGPEQQPPGSADVGRQASMPGGYQPPGPQPMAPSPSGYYSPAPQPMAPSSPGYYSPPPPTNTMAILSLVFAFVVPILGIVFGYMAKKQIRERGEGGAGLAKAGLILGYIFAALTLLYVIAVIALINSDT